MNEKNNIIDFSLAKKEIDNKEYKKELLKLVEECIKEVDNILKV